MVVKSGLLLSLFSSLLVLGTSLSGCVSIPQQVNTTNFKQIQQLSSNTVVKEDGGVNMIRQAALKETALSFGAQAGLAWRSKRINLIINDYTKNLDRIFNFNGLLLKHHVLPPVLSEAKDTLNLSDDTTLRIADHRYRITRQARFVTAPPNWRDYIWLHYDKPAPPDHSLLPRNTTENKIWRRYIKQGWENGIRQSDDIYTENLQRLRRDYQGMVLYRKLLAQNMVGQPFVSTTKLGITGDASKMNVDDQILRITQLPALQTNGKTWNPVIIHDHSSWAVTII